MAEELAGKVYDGPAHPQDPLKSTTEHACNVSSNRKEKRKALKKEKRKQKRKELAAKERQEEEARLNDPEELRRIQLEEERENERLERERKEYEEHERLFLEALAEKRKAEEEEEERRKALEEESKQNQAEHEHECNDDWEYIEEGPPEIIWQGNEIIVKKKKVKVKKKDENLQVKKQSSSIPTSNPLPPQSEAFADYNSGSVPSAQHLLEDATEQIPNFGTELDKTHCPFHLKTGACRFGLRCSRVHFYPDKSCTLLIKNMYNGPGLAWEQDEGLEYMDDEVERCYEEFYEDVHTEFLKFGEIVNFKVCKNGSFHLRGNVYVHYKSVDSAVLAYQSINGRYFAGKQVSLEFVGVTKWKVAICGEFMKSRLKTCTRGTACNFIHCFRNPGGDYEWADWDKPPPKYWLKTMAALFGYPEEYRHDSQIEKGVRKSMTSDQDRYHIRRSRSRERGSSRNRHEKSDSGSRHHRHRTSWSRKLSGIHDEENRGNDETNHKNKDIIADSDSDRDLSRRDRGGDRHRNRTRKEKRRNRIAASEILDGHEDNDSGSDSDTNRGRNRNHNSTREASNHQKEKHEVVDEYDKKSTHSPSSSRNLSSRYQNRDMHSEQSKKSYGHRSKGRGSHDDYGNSREKTHASESRNEDVDRYDSRSRRHARDRYEESGLAGAHEISKTDESHIAESDSKELESQRVGKRQKLSRWDPLNMVPSEDIFTAEVLESDRHCETANSSPRDEIIKSRYSTSECNETVEEGNTMESGDRISRKQEKPSKDYDHAGTHHRSKSRDSGRSCDKGLKVEGRRSSDERYPSKHYRSRKRSSPVDYDRCGGNSSTHEQSSDERYSERSISGVRRRRSHQESLVSLEGVVSDEEREDSKGKRHRPHRRHRTHGHRHREKSPAS